MAGSFLQLSGISRRRAAADDAAAVVRDTMAAAVDVDNDAATEEVAGSSFCS